ncbi:hypothetical protein CY35_01G142700 [Sphagnum magellanicum]|nr:hypothetical protein CY35_01G142700 [Sphagnum magellanicum]
MQTGVCEAVPQGHSVPGSSLPSVHSPCAGGALLVRGFEVIEIAAQNDVVRCEIGLSYSVPEKSSLGGGLGGVHIDDCEQPIVGVLVVVLPYVVLLDERDLGRSFERNQPCFDFLRFGRGSSQPSYVEGDK